MVKTEEDITKLIKFFKKEKYVVLFLYLMHYPSHAYSISLTFKRIKRSKLIDLSNKSKVSKFLSEMEKLKVVRHMQQGRKKMYMINPWFIKEQIFFPSNYTELGTSEQKMPKAQELIINFLNF